MTLSQPCFKDNDHNFILYIKYNFTFLIIKIYIFTWERQKTLFKKYLLIVS